MSWVILPLVLVGFGYAAWFVVLRPRPQPGEPPIVGAHVPYIGSGLAYMREGPAFIERQFRERGPAYTLYAGGRLVTMVSDPAFTSTFYMAKVAEMSFFEGLAALGITEITAFGLTGPEDNNQSILLLRKHIVPRMRKAAELVDAEMQHHVAEATAQLAPLDLRRLARRCIQGSSAKLLCADLARHPEFLALFDAIEPVAIDAAFGSARAKTKVARLRTRLLALVTALVRARRERAKSVAQNPEPDFVDVFLEHGRDARGEPFDDDAIAGEVLGMMFGSLANTPAGASMCLLQILAAPQLYAAVMAEQTRLREEHGDRIDDHVLKSAELLHACFLETLRCYSPAQHLRVTKVAMNEVAGRYTIPAERLVGVSPYAIHHDPQTYDDPEVFDPYRFVSGPRRPAGKVKRTMDFVPFGKGLHTCLGMALAETEVKTFVARLLRNVTFAASGTSALKMPKPSFRALGIAQPSRPVSLRYELPRPSPATGRSAALSACPVTEP